MASLLLLAACCALPAAIAQGGGSNGASSGGWRTARATYYGAPASFGKAYDPSRGNGSFGILAYGSCGYTNSDGSLPFPRAMYAASADGNPDFPGSCGRCYEIRCKPGLVLNNQQQPIQITNGYYEGDKFRPYLPAINANVTDSQGRHFPGNPAIAQGREEVSCNDPSKTLVVRIADSCPCTQFLPEGAPGVAKGGETRTQSWCCGGVEHFDLAYDAFEQLAHPLYGVTMLDYRPVDCDTKAALPFEPGYISKSVIYSGGIKAGWSWQSYKGRDFTLVTDVKTPNGNAATCASLTPGGGLFFNCRKCDQNGYRPFEGTKSVAFRIKPRADASNATSAGNGTQLPLKVFIRGEHDNYCGAEPSLSDLTPASTSAGGWARYDIPSSKFSCYDLGAMTHLELQSTAGEGGPDAAFCLGDVQLTK